VSWLILGIVVAALLGVATNLSWTAGRLDRLHNRVETGRAALDAQLFHRSGVALEVAAAGFLDPATALVLLDAAHSARAASGADREAAESDLTRTLSAAFGDPDNMHEFSGAPDEVALLDELAVACRRVELARRFHNDTVASALALRHRRLVRWFGLAGHSSPPPMVELDDVPPTGLAR
jgi:hypothetical protein